MVHLFPLPPAMATSLILVLVPALQPCIWSNSLLMCPKKKMTKVPGPLPPNRETQMEF